ncbi:MAG: hypothetical protein U0U67_06325 [Chitinophagales bacterium]
MEQIVTLNHKSKNLDLTDKYLFALLFSDGFTSRLLSAQYTIDWNYNYTLEMESFECRNNKIPAYLESGRISDDIHGFLEQLIESDYNSIATLYIYDNLFVNDIGSQNYFLNFDAETINITILNGVDRSKFKTQPEVLLFNFNQYLTKMIEEKYNIWRKD